MKMDELSVGQTHQSYLVESLSRGHISQYAGASGDFNRVHIDELYAVAAGRDSVIAHGMLTMGLLGSFVRRLVDGTTVRKLDGRFHAPVHPGDTLKCACEVTGLTVTESSWTAELSLVVTTQTDARVYSGSAVVEAAT